jgi:phosphoribosylanthranilate isomerase
MTLVKICGLKTPETITAAIEGGADFIGLVFHKPSPRHVDIEVAAYLVSYMPPTVKTVGLFVDPNDRKLENILSNVRLDMIQLHGQEPPERVAAIKAKFQRPIIKALGVDNLSQVKAQEAAADWIMIDAPGGGGGGAPFDWAALQGFSCTKPWMLAGGLTTENVGEAIRRTKPNAVDVSSGVESTRGVKDPAKIRSFLEVVQTTNGHE